MNTTDAGRIRKIMKRMRESRLQGTPSSVGELYGLGVMASGLDKIANLMTTFSRNNAVEGISDPESFNRALTAANIGMKMGTLAGAGLMRKFVSENYQYVVHPAIKSIGKAGGKYGSIVENYIKAKSDIKKSWGDIGANVGSAMSLWAGRFARGLRAVSIAAAGTGAGIPAALIGLAVSAAVQIIAGLLLPWLGRKAGELIAEKTGYIEKYSKNVLGEDMLKIVPEGAANFMQVAPSIIHAPWYDKSEAYDSYFSNMQDIQTREGSTGVSLRRLGITTRETGTLYAEISKSLRVDPKYRGSYTSTIGTINNLMDDDVTETFSGISQGSALSKTSNQSNEVDKTADAFLVFFDALTKGQRGVTKTSLLLTKELAAASDVYARRNILAKDTDVLFAGVQKFVNSKMQASGQQDTSESTGIIDIMDKVAKSTGTTSLGTQLSAYAGISKTDSQTGLNSAGFKRMSQSLSDTYNFGSGASVDKMGKLKLDENAKSTFAQLHRDATRSQAENGLELSSDEAIALAKYLVAFQTNPGSLKFGGPVTNPLGPLGAALKTDVFYDLTATGADMSDVYERLTSQFVKQSMDLSDTILNMTTSITEQIAKGALDLLATSISLTSGKIDGNFSGTGSFASSSSSTPTYSGPVAVSVVGKTSIGRGNAMIAPQGFKEESDAVAKRVGIDPKVLYSFFGAESSFGTNTKNYANAPYVGVGQVGVAATADVNKIFGKEIGRVLRRDVREDNMLIAAYYVKYIAKQIGTDDPAAVYAAYNRGFGAVQKNIAKYGKFTPAGFNSHELNVGLGNVSRSLAGYDQLSSSVTFAQPAPPTPEGGRYDTASSPWAYSAAQTGVQAQPGVISPGGLFKTVQYAGGVIRGADLRPFGKSNTSRRSSEAKLFVLSGVHSEMGDKSAAYLEGIFATGGASFAGKRAKAERFWAYCATVAGAAIDAGGFRNRATGDAEDQRRQWETWDKYRNATFTLAQIQEMGGFQPGDVIYVRGGNHVGVVVSDGTVIQAGFAQNTDGSYLARTDATSFEYQGLNNIMVVRPSVDTANEGGKSNGIITPAERLEAIRIAKAGAGKAPPPITKPAAPKPAATPTINKTVVGSKYIARTTSDGKESQFVVKNKNATGLSTPKIATILRKEAALEKALGLTSEQLSIGVIENATGSKFLNVKINVVSGDVGKIAQKLLREIERLI